MAQGASKRILKEVSDSHSQVRETNAGRLETDCVYGGEISSGKIHQKASLILASAFSVGAIVTSNPGMFECAVGAMVGIVVTPDWDVDKTFIGNKIIKKRFGYRVERIFNGWLKPYKTSFKHGRFGSHFPVYGTYGRLFYILYTLIVPFYVVYFLILLSSNYHFNLIIEGLWWVRILFISKYTIGLIGSDLIHYFLDILTTNSE